MAKAKKTDRELFEADRDLTNLKGIIFTFMTEDGRKDITYKAYLEDTGLREKVNDPDRYRLILGRTIFTYPMIYLRGHPKTHSLMVEFEREKTANPLRFFAPSGKQALDFLNDTENDVCILTAPNRAGKTQTMLIKKLINLIPCDPTWEIFSKYGVKHRPWRGAKTCGLSTYELASHSSTILPMLLDWIPTKELGVYAKDYKGKGAKTVSLKDTDPKIPLECGSTIGFFTVTQKQARYESSVVEDWGWDEQGDEERFDGADERSRTTASRGRHDFGLTPHKIAGRPDTGAGSWISKMTEGEMTKGRKVAQYEMEVYDVPDWIYSEESKLIAFVKHILEPERMQNVKAQREGLSRYRGKFHEASGLVIDEWDSTKHVIEPFPIPPHWSRFRALDHGDKHPAACYDSETEVLTDGGWKRFSNLEYMDKVATVDAELRIEYQQPTAYIDERYSGEMMVREDRCSGLNFAVTPNHMMVNYPCSSSHKNTPSKIRLTRCDEVATSALIPTAPKSIGGKDGDKLFVVPRIRKSKKDLSCSRSAYASLLGWFISDGSISPDKYRNKTLRIHQKTHIDKLEPVLNATGWDWWEYTRKSTGVKTYSIGSSSLHSMLSECCLGYKGGKRLPSCVWEWEEESLQCLFQGLMDGDGHFTDCGDFYSTVSPELADDFQRLCILLGKATKVRVVSQKGNRRDLYHISILKAVTSRFDHKKVERRHYDGRIYCVTVPNHTLIVRRGGRPMICGNCLFAAMSPAGDLFIYREYLRTGRVPTQICKDVIEMSGNKRRLIGQYNNPRSEQIYNKYEEVQCGEAFQWTVFDARAFSMNSAGDGIPLSKIYGFAGLKLKKGSGYDSDHYVPILKEWFVVDMQKKHFVTKELGAPRVYVFNTCTDFIKTIKRWVWVDRKTSSTARFARESPTKKDDDLMDCCKLLIQAKPKFRGNPRMLDNKFYDGLGDEDEADEKLITNRPIDPMSGY